VFAGLTSVEASALPQWYREITESFGVEYPEHSFMSAIDALPRAEKRRTAYWDDELEQWVEVERHDTLVNPEWLGRDPETASDPNDAAWHIPTSNYDIVNPLDAYKPLVRAYLEVAEKSSVQNVCGEIREYRNGGEVHMDVFFTDVTVPAGPDSDDTLDEIVLGLQSGYDFFASTKLYSKVVAVDPNTEVIMRDLSERRSRRHVKPSDETGTTAHDVAKWWSVELDRLETVSETLFEVIYDAQSYDVDFSEFPQSPRDFYVALDVPDGLAKSAHSYLTGGSESDSVTVDMWELYSALAHVVTNEYNVKDDGGALADKVQIANTILFRPGHAVDRALDEFQKHLENQTTLSDDDERAVAVLESTRETARDRMDEFDDLRGRIAAMLDEAESSDGGDDDGDSDSDDDQTTTATA
jgi:hypothetical protein